MSMTALLVAASLLIAPTESLGSPAPPGQGVRLVVQIVVDGLKPDLVHRVNPRLNGGLRYLLDRGVEYRNARYAHSATATAAGHATIATGAYPPQHGIVGNGWYDVGTGQYVYSVGDPRYPILGGRPGADAGRSPAALLVRTVGDELVASSNGRSRVFSVSEKDRAAILSGGHSGQAYWLAPANGRFVTSTYYRRQYPAWAQAWNDADHGGRLRDHSWTLLRPRRSYRAQQDDRPEERGYQHLGRTFPHRLDCAETSQFYTALRFTPLADELLVSFAKALVEHEGVGGGVSPDLLAISLSSTDYIQHRWGPGSLEAEDNLLRLDATLAQLFEFLDQAVGLDKTLLVLSADHGFDEIPEVRLRRGGQAGRLDPRGFRVRVTEALKARFGTSQELVLAFATPWLYLDVDAIRGLGLDLVAVEREAARALRLEPGIARAVTRTEIETRQLPDDPMLERVQRSFHPARSGQVMIVQDRFWLLQGIPDGDAAMHGSPYDYDTRVPLFFCGPGIQHAVVSRAVGIEDVAPTIAAYLGIAALADAVGQPLKEVVGP